MDTTEPYANSLIPNLLQYHRNDTVLALGSLLVATVCTRTVPVLVQTLTILE